jgi:hypothetical protein
MPNNLDPQLIGDIEVMPPVPAGFWADAVRPPAATPEPVGDPADMSLEEYTAARSALGIDHLGVQNLGRAPGHERQAFMGHTLEEGSGFPSWRDFSANRRVYR